MITQAPKGTRDIFGEEMRTWQTLEHNLRALTSLYGFSEIRTPMFEHTELFLRGVGETTDVVQKEMYSFNDKAGRGISLRPEMTAGVARAYVEHGMHVYPQPVKLYYIGPNFRYENPQAGRYRQHFQFGVEMFGAYSAAAEAEIISLGHALINRLGVQDVSLHVNSIGCKECRQVYQQRLKDFLGENFNALCPTCRQRFEKNPLRVLDCKTEACRRLLLEAPSVLDALDDGCRTHFEQLQSLLTAMDITYVVDPKIVRGLDYYTRTVFEFIGAPAAGQTDGLTVIGGGRYDGLIAEVGGTPTGAVGFGMGMDRLVLLLQRQQTLVSAQGDMPGLYVGYAGEAGFTLAQTLAHKLRMAGIRAESDPASRSVKAQMKYAGKLGARYALIIGDNEIAQNEAAVKDMETGEQQRMALNDIRGFVSLLEKAGKTGGDA